MPTFFQKYIYVHLCLFFGSLFFPIRASGLLSISTYQKFIAPTLLKADKETSNKRKTQIIFNLKAVNVSPLFYSYFYFYIRVTKQFRRPVASLRRINRSS